MYSVHSLRVHIFTVYVHVHIILCSVHSEFHDMQNGLGEYSLVCSIVSKSWGRRGSWTRGWESKSLLLAGHSPPWPSVWNTVTYVHNIIYSACTTCTCMPLCICIYSLWSIAIYVHAKKVFHLRNLVYVHTYCWYSINSSFMYCTCSPGSARDFSIVLSIPWGFGPYRFHCLENPCMLLHSWTVGEQFPPVFNVFWNG